MPPRRKIEPEPTRILAPERRAVATDVCRQLDHGHAVAAGPGAAAVVASAVGVALCVAVALAVALAEAVAFVVAFFVATGFALFVAVVVAVVATAFVEVDDEAAAVDVVPVEPIAAPPAILIEPLDVS